MATTIAHNAAQDGPDSRKIGISNNYARVVPAGMMKSKDEESKTSPHAQAHHKKLARAPSSIQRALDKTQEEHISRQVLWMALTRHLGKRNLLSASVKKPCVFGPNVCMHVCMYVMYVYSSYVCVCMHLHS